MRAIRLTNGDIAIVDDEDFERVSQHNWYLNRKRNGPYAITKIDGETVGMHRFILGLKKGDGLQGDHRDGDGLNNCRSNLRIATGSDNQRNQVRRVPKHGYLGICPFGKSWVAYIHVHSKRIHLGSYPTKEAAAVAYDKSAREVYGEFAVPNFPTADPARALVEVG